MDFINDKEKMEDFKNISKEEFLKSYSYLTEKEYEATKKRICNFPFCNKITVSRGRLMSGKPRYRKYCEWHRKRHLKSAFPYKKIIKPHA